MIINSSWNFRSCTLSFFHIFSTIKTVLASPDSWSQAWRPFRKGLSMARYGKAKRLHSLRLQSHNMSQHVTTSYQSNHIESNPFPCFSLQTSWNQNIPEYHRISQNDQVLWYPGYLAPCQGSHRPKFPPRCRRLRWAVLAIDNSKMATGTRKGRAPCLGMGNVWSFVERKLVQL